MTGTGEHSSIVLLVQLAQLVTVAIVVPGTFALIRALWSIQTHLAALNGRMGRLETWKEDHEHAMKLDGENHALTREQCQALHAERLSSVYKQIDVLYQRLGDRRQGERSTD